MKPILSFITILCCILFSSCKKHHDEPGKEEETTHRTVLVYMVADNTLSANSSDDITEMIMAAGANQLNGGRLIVYYNRPGTNSGEPPRLIEITGKGTEVLKAYPDDPNIYSVDPARIREVMSDMKKYAPADDYGLVLWSHADGWIEHDGDFMSRSFGDDRGKHITLPALAKALDGNYFSFIYFDCCLMGSIEVAYEMRHLTPVIVASPTELPTDGMPYNQNVACFFTKGKPDMIKAALNTYNFYAGTYATHPDNSFCQMVVINTESIQDLANASRDIFATMTTYPTSDEISNIQKYGYSSRKYWSYDMKQYFELIAGKSTLYKAWESAFNSTVQAAHTTPVIFFTYVGNRKIDTYNGLGSNIILSPSDITYRGYNNCAWYKDVVSASPLYAE